jgi:hypothetical protein
MQVWFRASHPPKLAQIWRGSAIVSHHRHPNAARLPEQNERVPVFLLGVQDESSDGGPGTADGGIDFWTPGLQSPRRRARDVSTSSDRPACNSPRPPTPPTSPTSARCSPPSARTVSPVHPVRAPGRRRRDGRPSRWGRPVRLASRCRRARDPRRRGRAPAQAAAPQRHGRLLPPAS